MREVIGLGQLRSDACTYLDRVGAGATIDVVRRGKLVARIEWVGDRRMGSIPERTPMTPEVGGSVGLDELRRCAGRCFDRVAMGKTIEVVRGGEMVARIVSAAGDDDRRTA